MRQKVWGAQEKEKILSFFLLSAVSLLPDFLRLIKLGKDYIALSPLSDLLAKNKSTSNIASNNTFESTYKPFSKK